MSACRSRGFTLIEVLIALAVVALVLTALTRVAALEVGNFDGLRERTLASWVAANVIAETRIAEPTPPTGTRDGRVRFAGRDWRWTMTVQATPEPTIRRLDVGVFLGEAKAPSATLTGFAAQEPPS